jgi:hypothetical protein
LDLKELLETIGSVCKLACPKVFEVTNHPFRLWGFLQAFPGSFDYCIVVIVNDINFPEIRVLAVDVGAFFQYLLNDFEMSTLRRKDEGSFSIYVRVADVGVTWFKVAIPALMYLFLDRLAT